MAEFLDVLPFVDDALAMQPKHNISLMGVAKDLAGFAVGMAVLGKASEMGARGFYKSIVKSNAAFGESIAKNVGEDVVKSSKFNMGSLFRGVRQTLADRPQGVFNITTDNGAKMMDILSTSAKASIEAGKAMKSAYTSWSSSESLVKKGVAGFGRAMYRSAPLAAGMYGLQRLTGTGEGNQPAWYNVPGHIAEIAKSTANFAAFDIGTHGLKQVGGFVKNIAKEYLSQEASPGLHAFVDRHFAITRTKDGAKPGTFLNTVIRTAALMDGARAAARSVSDKITNTLGINFGDAQARRQQQSSLFDFTNKNYYRKMKNEAIERFKGSYKDRMDSLRNYRSDYGHDFIQGMNDLLAKHANVDPVLMERALRNKNKSEAHAFMRTHFGETSHIFHGDGFVKDLHDLLKEHSLKASNTMGGSILGRQTVSMGEFLSGADTQHFHFAMKLAKQHASNSVVRGELTNLHKSFLSLKAGPNIYKGMSGIVDYGMYSPKNLASSFLSFINPYFTIGALGRELPLVKMLGLDQYLAKNGLGIHSIRADEGQQYHDLARGKRTVGDDYTHPTGNLGGVLLDGKLYVTNSRGYLEQANAAKQKMVYSTPYSRDAVLTKLNALPKLNGSGGVIDGILKNEATSQKGVVGRFKNFTSRWGLQLPSPIQGLMEGFNRFVGSSPMQTGVKHAVDLMLDPRSSAASVGGDLNAILTSVGHMSGTASKSLYGSLSDPEMLQIMARLSKNVGGAAGDRASALVKAFTGSEQELMDVIRGRGNISNDETLKYALEHNRHFGTHGSDEQVFENKFSFRQLPLTKRQEVQRKLLHETMGLVGLPGKDSEGFGFNLVDHMLKDSEVTSRLSQDNLRDLKMMGTHIDLFRFGYLDGAGKVAQDNTPKAMHDAMNIIRNRLGDERQYLEQKMFDTPMIKRIGVFGFGPGKVTDRGNFINSYARYLEDSKPSKMHGSPFLMTEADTSMSGIGFHINTFLDRVMDMGNHLGLKYSTADRSPYTFKLPGRLGSLFGAKPMIGDNTTRGLTLGGPMSVMIKRVAQGVGVLAAAQAVDTFTSSVPLFKGTILANGIFSAAADVYIKGSMAYHKAQDLTGITGAAKYLEGLMPSSTSTIPGMIIGGFTKGPLGILPGAVINRFMAVNGITPQFDKSYDDMKEVYSGRELVPVRRNRFWLFSKAPYEGDGPQYFRPHWYPRLKSDYKHTDTLYGSKTEAFLYAPWAGLGYNPIAQVLDKYHYEKKHYWDRPYPVTAPAFSEVPVIGPILSATIGRLPIIGKPIKHMHLDEMSHYYSMNGSNTSEDGELSTSHMPSVSQSEQYMFMDKVANTNSSAALYGGGRPKNLNPYGAMTLMGEQLYNFTELAGLRGYQLESFMGGGLADTTPRLQTASDMWSARRAWWDMSAGDIFGSTEFFRRFVPREKKIWQKVNPLRNRFPNWMPSEENDYFMDFLTGDPYAKIPEGEMRLPGNAYNKLYDVKRTFPGRASSFGNTVMESVREMTGLSEPFDEEAEDVTAAGTAMHRYIQDSMMRANVGIKAEALVYDAKNDISGHIDLIMHDPQRKGGKRVLEIKTVSGKKFAGIKSPIPHHISQVNFYLRQMQMDVGTLLYINRDDPSQIRTFDVRYNEQRFRKDVKDLTQARKIAAGIVATGKGYETGTSYSWLDRLRILGDVAPYSKEYKDAAQIVAMQLKENKLTEKDKAEVMQIKKRRQSVMRKVDLYPTRFRSRIFNPDTTYELQSENTNIKAAASYSVSERIAGAIWERAIQMDTPLNLKLWNYKSPLQHYKSTKIYGTEAAAWNRPYQDLIHPMMTKALSADNPIDAAASFGWIGGLGMGGMGNMAVPGAAFGALYGAARKVVGNGAWIPDEINRKRKIESDFDELKYIKAMSLYNQTGDQQYLTQADETMWNIRHTGYDVNVHQAMRSLSTFEKPYFISWMKETNPNEREHILSMVPEDVGNLLKAKWGLTYDTPSPSKFENPTPNADWEGLLPTENLDDIKLKTINQEGLRASDFGLGWYDQQRRVSGSNADLNPITNVNQVATTNHVAAKIRNALCQQLRSVARRPLVNVSLTPGTGSDSVQINLNIMRDRFMDIANSLRAR